MSAWQAPHARRRAIASPLDGAVCTAGDATAVCTAGDSPAVASVPPGASAHAHRNTSAALVARLLAAPATLRPVRFVVGTTTGDRLCTVMPWKVVRIPDEARSGRVPRLAQRAVYPGPN
jgi:hypothetical protein